MSQFDVFIEKCREANVTKAKMNKVDWVEKPNCIIEYYPAGVNQNAFAIIYVEAPGFSVDQFDVILFKGSLEVTADKTLTADDTNTVLYEFNKKLHREFKVGDKSAIKLVEYINGVLMIQIEDLEPRDVVQKFVPNQPIQQIQTVVADRRASKPGTTSAGSIADPVAEKTTPLSTS